jgi:hypothetical protein
METESSEEISDQEKCIRLYVLTAARNAKFLLSQQKAEQFTAKIATGIIKNSKISK